MRAGLIKLYICGILIISIYKLPSLAQNFSGLYDIMTNKEKSTIDKALKEITEAGKLIQEANQYYNEALSLQSNYELDEKTLQSKLTKAEEKAISTQIKADKLYASAYKSLYEICSDILDRSAVSYGEIDELKNSATELMNNAMPKREEAENIRNPYEKASLMNDAAGYEAAAIDNLITAIQIQNGISPAEPARSDTEIPYTEEYVETITPSTFKSSGEVGYSSKVQQKSENLAVDQNVIEKYDEYVNDASVPDPIMINRSGVVGVDDVSVDNARNIFYNYHQGDQYIFSEQYSYTPDLQAAIEDSVRQVALLDQELYEKSYDDSYETIQDRRDETKISDILGGKVKPEDQKRYKEQTPDLESFEDSRLAYDLSSTPQATNINFVVQLAASRIPLARPQLWAIYPGNYTVEVMQEEGWYKYRITGFRLFSVANRVALESGVRDAWVLSYQHDSPVDLVEAREMTRVLETDVKRYGQTALKGQTDFYVQVVASRTRLDEQQMMMFCGVAGLCREIIEEGWFKYQIFAGTHYEEAMKLKDQLNVNSFIMAYERGTKVKLYKAINKNK